MKIIKGVFVVGVILFVGLSLKPYTPIPFKCTCLLTCNSLLSLARECLLEEASCTVKMIDEKKINKYIAQNEFTVSFLVKDDDHIWNFIKKLHKNSAIVILSKEIVLERFSSEKDHKPWLKGRYRFLCFNVSPIELSS